MGDVTDLQPARNVTVEAIDTELPAFDEFFEILRTPLRRWDVLRTP